MRLVLAPWEWHTEAGESYWRKPGGDYTGGCLDLRTLGEAGTPGAVASGLGLFAYEDLPSGIQVAADLGDDPLAAMTSAQRRDLGTALGLDPRQLGGTTLAEALAEYVMGGLADPSGQTRTKPLRTNRRGCALHLKGFGRIYSAPLDRAHPAYAQTLAVRRLDYERNRVLILDRYAKAGRSEDLALDVLRRWTGWDMRALGATEEELLPEARLSDGSRTPATILTESWPTDGTNFATGQDQPWSVLFETSAGDAQVSTNRLICGTAGARIVLSCDSALSSDDHRITSTANIASAGNGGNAQTAVRYDAAASGDGFNTAYYHEFYREGASRASHLLKSVNGSVTALEVNNEATNEQEEVRVEADGSSISGYVGDNILGPVTDTDITGNLQGGARIIVGASSTPANVWLDDHTIEDLAAASSGTITAAAEAGSTFGATAVAAGSLSAAAQADDAPSALATAAALIAAAASADDAWSATAAAFADLVDQAVADEDMSALATAGAVLTAGATASDEYSGSDANIASVTEAATASEAFSAAAEALAAFVAAAQADEQVAATAEAAASFSAGAVASDAWSATAVVAAAWSAGAEAAEAMSGTEGSLIGRVLSATVAVLTVHHRTVTVQTTDSATRTVKTTDTSTI